MKTYPYAIFDMDGTLLDSMKVWKNLGRNYLELIGIRPPEDLEEHLATMSMLEGAEYFHRELGVKATPQEIIRGLNRQIEDAYRETLPLKKGVREYLSYLQEQGVKMGVLTATPSYMAKLAFDRLNIGKYFEFVMDCEEAGGGKTEPGCYMEATRRLGGKPWETTEYEDADFALETAKKAGFYTVGIFDETMADRRAYLQELCDRYVDSYVQLQG